MAAIKVHGHHFSTATAMVLCCLNEKEVECDFVLVDLNVGAQKQPQYLVLNPFGLVPAIEDGDLTLFGNLSIHLLLLRALLCCGRFYLLVLNPFGLIPAIQDGDLTLFESRAIVKYLAKKYKEQGTDLLGNTLAEQALVEQWCEVEAQSFYSPANTILFEIFLSPLWGGSTDEAAVEINIGKLNKILDIYEERLSKSKYLAGDFFSLADLQHLPWTQYLVTICKKGDMISSRKHVKAWWEDISSRPAWKKVAGNMRK